MGILEIKSLTKSYGAVRAVNDFSHRFSEGKITAVVGPSGSGKSTLLWMIAGLQRPDQGRVFFDEKDLTAVLPENRDFGMVFQNYALFPHLTVRENVEFGLRVRHITKNERGALADEALELVKIGHLRDRRINQISGGEQQRVALARALAIKPKVLLMDEPLSALDAKLREQVRAELFRLLNSLRITTVYVTHDQVEAMSLGSELIVMDQGSPLQVGHPLDVYRKPVNKFVAEFLGSANIFEGRCVEKEGKRSIQLPFTVIDAPPQSKPGSCWVMIRPEDMRLTADDDAHFIGVFESSLFLGNQIRINLSVAGQKIILDVENGFRVDKKDRLPVQIKTDKVFVWERQGPVT